MAQISRVRAALTGFPGGPGVSTFYGLDGPALSAQVQSLYDSLKAYTPTDVHIQVSSIGDIIEDTTGALVGQWNTGVLAGLQGLTSDVYAAPVGVLLRWETGVILDGHRLRGRTFFVPVGSGAFANDGTLTTPVQDSFASVGAATVQLTAGNMVVWHRPRLARAANGTVKAVTARAGGHAVITGSSVPYKAVVLRSRRD